MIAAALEAVLCWLNRPRPRVRQVVDTDDGPCLDLCCSYCRKAHA